MVLWRQYWIQAGITHYNSHNISSLSFSWTNNDIIHIQNIHTTTYDNQLLDSVRTAMSQVVYYTVEMVLYTQACHTTIQFSYFFTLHWTNYDGGSNRRIRLEYKKAYQVYQANDSLQQGVHSAANRLMHTYSHWENRCYRELHLQLARTIKTNKIMNTI